MIRCELDPASGSVMANAMVMEPSAMPGNQRFFWSSVPNLLMMVPLMAGWTTIISSAARGRHLLTSSRCPRRRHPYSSGRLTPMKPSLPASCHNSLVC